MSRRRTLILSLLIVVLAGAALWIYLSSTRPPKLVRMLPDSSSILYANIAPIRTATHFDQRWNFEHEAAYDEFVSATGIQPARDLDELAMSVHGTHPNEDRRYSELMRGKFNLARLEDWLKHHADSTEQYAGKTIFTITHEGRPVRVAILSNDLVGISNTNDPANIRAIVDHHNALPPAPESLRANYKEIPVGTPVWWIGKLDSTPSIPLGSGNSIEIGVPAGTTLIASMRYTGALKVHVSALTSSEQDAATLIHQAQSLLKLASTLASQNPDDPDSLKQISNSVSLEQSGSKVVLNAELPQKLVEDLARASPGQPPQQH